MMKPRFNLTDVAFTEKSAAKIEAEIINNYKSLTGQSLGKADPRRKFIQAIVPIIAQQRVLIDYAAKQNLISYSTADNLEHIGELMGTGRLAASYATTTLRFTLSIGPSQALTIPLGTRVTAGDDVFWSTTETLTIVAGSIIGDVEARCEVVGATGNGYLVGEINQLLSPISYVQSVSNTTESEGGQSIENDDLYADRIHMAPESFSVAGPDGAYVYWARTANQTIVDVSVRSPSPGVVEIRPLLAGGGLPGQEILDNVLAICGDKNVRPLTDNVQVLAPERVSYDITATYYIKTSDSSVGVTIQTAVTKSVADYKVWQKSKLGRDIDPSELITRIKNAGAKRVVVAFPEYQQLEKYQVATENLVTVTYGGLEDE